MLSRLLSFLGATPTTVVTINDLRRGAVRAQGTLVCATPLSSPIHGDKCAGFLYQASHLGWRTYGPSSRKPLTRALVYANPLMLRLVDETELPLIPRKSDPFEAEGHAHLAQRDLPGFRAVETLLALDEAVRIHGSAKKGPAGWTIYFDEIVRPPAAADQDQSIDETDQHY